MDFKNGTATFVMPILLNWEPQSKQHLSEAIDSIFKQTDPNWQLVIIDDFSPAPEARAHLAQLEEKHPGKIKVILKDTNEGPGVARNRGIQWAHDTGSPFIIYLDADDIAHPERVATVRKTFVENPGIGVVYTTFKVIDEYSNVFPVEKLSPSITDILAHHEPEGPQGDDVWITIGTRTGYTNLTSATAVTTALARQFPFPPERVSEDWHTWVRYSAGGGTFCYTGTIPTLYRIPLQSEGSASRTREGGKRGFYTQVVRNNTKIGRASCRERV